LRSAPAELPPTEGRFAFRTYAEEDGLGNLTIECLLQDRTGFLWVGTQDGLFRFDGSRFLRFGREEGLPSTRINCLHETADGRLYAGTRSGLARRLGDRFQAIGPDAGLPESSIPDEGIASDRELLFVALPSGLYVGSKDRFRLEPRGQGEREVPVSGLHVAPDGALFFARRGTLERRLSGVTEDYGRPRGLPDSEAIDQTVTDGEGTLWVRSLKRLYRMRRGEGRFSDASVGLPAGVSSGRLELDQARRLMVPTQRGLARISGDGWQLLGRSRGLETDTVLSALVDREGSLWVGTAGVGLAQQLGRGTFTSWGTAEGLPHDVVWSMVREKLPSRSLWVGTQEGVARFDSGGVVQVFREGDGLGGNTVYALAASEDGCVWAGSWPGGVTRFGPERRRIRSYTSRELPVSEFRIAALFVDSDGTIWAGARSGLYRLDPRGSAASFEKVSSPPGGEEPDSIFGIADDASGGLFAVGRFGLQAFGPSPRRYRKADGLKSDFLASIVLEPGGALIAGYREALGAERVTFPDGRFAHRVLDRSTGLTADKVILVGRDSSQNLWIGSGNGVDVLPPGQSRPAHYGRSSGLISEDLDQNAFFAEPSGTVWLGTSRGLVRYLAGAEASASPLPPILVTEATAGRRRLDPLARGAAQLSRDERSVRVAWAGLTFLDPRRVRYRYRLSGQDDGFTETAMTEARFPALPSGDYRFEVLAISAAGGVSHRPATLSFRVLPAWWERWWARGGAVAALILLGLGLVRLRTRALEADRNRLEAAVAARSSELAAANRELEEASTTDPLTKLRNRRYFSMVVEEDARRALRAYRGTGGPRSGAAPDHRDLIFYVLDLDHFKSVNDRFGHDAGDRVLIEAAARLRRVARQSDLVMRWGGEEFLIVSRDAERGNGSVLARRLLEALAAEPFDAGEGAAVPLTGSVGWAPYPWEPNEPEASTHEDVLRLADRALYAAKADGRNCGVAALAASPEDASAERAGNLVYKLVTTPGT
jgi:diguanylate cyclase (GGDEF)-like protein